ncbi:MAG: efflux RND transporter periplasmic adaptor subunit [Herbaspirillum sp.]
MMRPLVALMATALLLCACDARQTPAAPATPEVGVVTLQTASMVLKTELSGRTAAASVSEVRPQVAGIVKARRFEEGSLVKAGQVLYEIDPATYRAARDEAQAALANADASVAAARLKDERYAQLVKIEGVSQQDADDAHAAYLQAVADVAQKKAALETARINLDYTQVRAAIGGRIGTSSVTPGALVTASQTTALATIRALDPMYVDLTQSSAAMLRLRAQLGQGRLKAGGTDVRLVLEDGSTYAHAGRMKFAEVAVDEATGSVTLRAEFANPDGVLLPGMYVRAQLDEAVDNAALLAPQQGIARDPKGNATALVVGADGKVAQRTVVTERALGNAWRVTSGLAAGDRLVVEGLNKIRAGQTVKAVEVQVGAVAANSAPALAKSTER